MFHFGLQLMDLLIFAKYVVLLIALTFYISILATWNFDIAQLR
jgi:hypothetical protein